MAYLPKNELTQQREEKVITLRIPLLITGNATAASVSLLSDEPSFVFMKTDSVDQITAALATSETATFNASTTGDASGKFQCLVAVNESVSKVVGARLTSRTSTTAFTAILGSSTGITTGSGGGQKIMLACVGTSVDLTGANTINAMLEVSYVPAARSGT